MVKAQGTNGRFQVKDPAADEERAGEELATLAHSYSIAPIEPKNLILITELFTTLKTLVDHTVSRASLLI